MSQVQPEFTTIRFTSIEPIQPLNHELEEIALSSGCEIEIDSRTTVNAPFCGIDYHVQEIRLFPTSGVESGQIQLCLQKFDDLECRELADGFFEIVG